ncbi:hypothetical protein LZK98_13980 [Sphingomonas cannabina]|uniref:hypothetical protein n=1 Tax=Sphingomonas cannabina TaxID=2899123 RepID=UPI001F427F5D|nr:hypothetical protein [Sphingomonas cannabina]UIJ44179.1 hypothetical protein LZK98_13980 [Sphingomonas cannabina]
MLGIIAGAAALPAQERPKWVQDGDDLNDMEKDLAQCKYEAAAATATIGTNDRPKSTSEAVSSGVSSGVVAGMEQASLIKKCMKAKGYRKAK